MKSIAARLRSGLWLALAAATALVLWLGGQAVHQLLGDYVGQRLGHDAEALLGAVELNADDVAASIESRLAPVYRQPFSGHYYVLMLDSGERIRSRSLWDQDLSAEAVSPGQVRLSSARGPQDQTLMVRSAGYRKQGRALTLVLAEDVSAVEQASHRYRWLIIGGAMLLGLALMLLQHRTVKRSLQPLEQARTDIGRIADGAIERLDERAPRELTPLIGEINRLLERNARHLERSRNALGNLTHAMKTPLSRLTQLARASEIAARPELAAQFDAQLSDLRQLIERELTRARLSGSATPGQHFDAADELPPLIHTLEQIYRERALHISVGELPGQPIRCDRQDMLELLGNLLDNGCKWAAREVRIDLWATDGEVRICVDDDGPGIAESQRQALLARGARADEAIAGHGIGLTIVQDIVAAYDGQLRLERSADLGGLRAAVTLRTGN